MTLQNVSPLEFPSTQLTGIRGGDAALVSLVPHEGGLVQVGPAAAGTAVLVGAGIAGVGLLVGDVAPVEGGLVHQGREERPVAWNRGVRLEGEEMVQPEGSKLCGSYIAKALLNLKMLQSILKAHN